MFWYSLILVSSQIDVLMRIALLWHLSQTFPSNSGMMLIYFELLGWLPSGPDYEGCSCFSKTRVQCAFTRWCQIRHSQLNTHTLSKVVHRDTVSTEPIVQNLNLNFYVIFVIPEITKDQQTNSFWDDSVYTLNAGYCWLIALRVGQQEHSNVYS